MGRSLVLHVLDKVKFWPDEKSEDHQSDYKSSKQSKFHSNPSSNLDISIDLSTCQPHGGARGKDHQSQCDSFTIDASIKFHPSSSRCDISAWTKVVDWPTDRHCHLYSCWLGFLKTSCSLTLTHFFLKLFKWNFRDLYAYYCLNFTWTCQFMTLVGRYSVTRCFNIFRKWLLIRAEISNFLSSNLDGKAYCQVCEVVSSHCCGDTVKISSTDQLRLIWSYYLLKFTIFNMFAAKTHESLCYKCTLFTVTVGAASSPGEPYSWRGRRQILGMTSISVLTYCSMVPCSCKVTGKIDGTQQARGREGTKREHKKIHGKDAARWGEGDLFLGMLWKMKINTRLLTILSSSSITTAMPW